MLISFPYGTTHIDGDLPDERLLGVLTRDAYTSRATRDGAEIVAEALENPIGTPHLRDMVRSKKKIVLICSDQTRAVPSKIIIPAMLREIRTGNPDADITLLIAGGGHTHISEQELINKFGEDIVREEKIAIHDADDPDGLVEIGVLPSGGPLIIDRLAWEADFLCAEGLLEPHFFAGFSGGRKSVLPGISARTTIRCNHCSANIASDRARTGILEGNPIHNDMLYAARAARLDFIVNVIINSSKELMYAFAGDVDLAHRAGYELMISQRSVKRTSADIVITSNGGYPLDQNIYQSVKCMTAGEACVNDGGVIICISRAQNGHGGESFYKTFKDEPNPVKMVEKFVATPKEETVLDQWQSQIFARIMQKAHVIFISDAADEMVRDFHMIPAHSVAEAQEKADALLGRKGSILAIPNGSSVIVTG